MSESCSIPTDWTLPRALASPAQRRVECLPAEPLSDRALTGLLGADAVAEVWLPVSQQHSGGTDCGDSSRPIRDVWVEFADRLHAIRYEQPGGRCPVAWYRALRPIEFGETATRGEKLVTQYTRLSDRPTATGP